jgi:hypothetical protein
MGRSLTRRDLAGRVDLAVRDLVDRADPVDLDPAVRDLAGLGLVVRDLVDRAGLAVRHPAGLADMPGLVDRAGLVVRDLVVREGLGLVDPVDLADTRGRVDLVVRDLVVRDLVVREGLGLVDPVDLADTRGRVDLAVRDRLDRAGLVVRVGLELVDPVDLADMRAQVGLTGRVDLDRVDPVDLHRRLTGRVALSTGVVPRWAAPIMRLTASAHPTTVRRLRRHNADSAGMVGPLPEGRRLTGSGRHLRVAGTDLRLPAVGTAHGMGRRAK